MKMKNLTDIIRFILMSLVSASFIFSIQLLQVNPLSAVKLDITSTVNLDLIIAGRRPGDANGYGLINVLDMIKIARII